MKNPFHRRGARREIPLGDTETQRTAKWFLFSLCLGASVVNGFAVAAESAPALYDKHCAVCHGVDRFGLMGPALLPENLSRLKKDAAAAMIRDSRPAVQMPPFKDVLKPEEIKQLADYIYTPVATPQWGEKEIRAWPVPVGATAPQAAGVIHSDFERGFIRAEIYSVSDLDQFKSEAAIRAAGKLRVEGKSYVMQDSDVCHFLFNV